MNSSQKDHDLLVSQWEANNFRDFNTWSQRAGVTIKSSFETFSLQTEKPLKTELCSIEVLFSAPNTQDICVKASGPNKKQAKKNALRLVVSQLFFSGFIKLDQKAQENMKNSNMKNSSFSLENSSFSIGTSARKSSETEYRENKKKKTFNKKISKIIEKMRICLKNNDFKGACLNLCHLLELKSCQWKDVRKIAFSLFFSF